MQLRATLVALTMAALTLGCAAERTLRVESDPPGATVRLGDDIVGVTPLVLDFTHYGTRRITLYLEGYRTETRLVELEPPWYGRFPLDLVSEVLLPIGWKDEHVVSAALIAGSDTVRRPELRSVFERAEALRAAGPAGPRELPPTTPASAPTDDEATP